MDESASFGRDSVIVNLKSMTGTVLVPGPAGAAPQESPAKEEKYVFQARIGAGGMGEVLLVFDKDLRRQVAMKILRSEISGNPVHQSKFVAEAQATSQLDHPGIPPVHDLGISPEGNLYFTMKLVRGRTLRDILKDLLLGVKEARQEFGTHRLVTVLERVAEAVHFAHEKGVIHRDLKPENLMLGSFGEVHVMDWGIARMTADPEEGGEGALDTEVTTAGTHTQDGVIKGTVPYMSPEQARGQMSRLDRRSDNFALGCILYEILTLFPAFDGVGPALLVKVRDGRCPPVRARNPRRPVPEALAVLCESAMDPDREKRPATARVFAEGLRAWLDGSSEKQRRHREAGLLLAEARKAASRHESLRARLADEDQAVEELAPRFRPHQDLEAKLPLLEARARVAEIRLEIQTSFGEAIRLLDAALVEESGHPEALRALGDLWAARLREAEERGEGEEASYALAMLRRCDDGTCTGLLRGEAVLALASNPPGAEVRILRFEDRHGVLVPGEERALGRTPLSPCTLPMGSYLCLLSRPGFRDTRFPVHLARNAASKSSVRLRTDEEIGEGFVHVPGGPFLSGHGKAGVPVDVPDFAIARFPVTFAQYADYLRAIHESVDPAEAAKRIPGSASDGPFMERTPEGQYRVVPHVVDGRARERWVREIGEDFLDRLPVIGVSAEDAEHYCRWRTAAASREFRLPTEMEREKAARGVDGRAFPWGNLEDACLAKCRDSREEPSQPEPVGAFPAAVSVYGMADAAGNVHDWTSSWSDGRRNLRVVKGGSWSSMPANLRCALRQVFAPDLRMAAVGFRVARGFDR